MRTTTTFCRVCHASCPMEVDVHRVFARFRMVAPLRATAIQSKAVTSHATV